MIKYNQSDAILDGAEAEISYEFSPLLNATVFGDYVNAELDSCENLPCISPQRIGARLDLTLDAVEADWLGAAAD